MRRYIYLIKNEDSEQVKVGIGKKPETRLKQLQTGSSGKLTLLYKREVEFASVVERNLHNFYSEQRGSGEWFDLYGVNIEDIDNQITLYEKNIIALKESDNPFV